MDVLYTFKGVGKKVSPTRLSNVNDFNLLPSIESSINKSIHEKRMLWEAWIESSDSFAELKESLKKRGYKNLPVNSFPKFKENFSSKISFGEKEKKRVSNIRNIKTQKTMLRRNNK
jgi:hypothetical protein